MPLGVGIPRLQRVFSLVTLESGYTCNYYFCVMMLEEHRLLVLFSVQRLGTISFGEFSAVLEQSGPVQQAEPGSTEAAVMDMDTSETSFVKSPPHSVLAGRYCDISSLFLNTPA